MTQAWKYPRNASNEPVSGNHWKSTGFRKPCFPKYHTEHSHPGGTSMRFSGLLSILTI